MNNFRVFTARAGLTLLASIALGSIQAAEPPSSDLGELGLEQLMQLRIEKVSSASKFEQKVTRAPASVTIVSSEEIEKFGHQTLADVMRTVRGFYASDDNNYSYLGARGFLRPGDYNTRMLVLVDGHRMNDNVYDGSYFGRENSIDLELVDRVEVVRGPSSSIYGSSAFFGIINVVTKRGAQFRGGVVSTEVGSFDSYKGRVTVGGITKEGTDWLFSASHYTSDGRKEIYYPEFDPRISDNPAAADEGVARNRDGESADNLFGRVIHGDLTFSAFFSRRRKDVPTAPFVTVFNDPAMRTTDYRAFFDAKYDHAITRELEVSARLFYDDYRYSGTYPTNHAEPGDPANVVFNQDYSYGQWVGTEWHAQARLPHGCLLMVGAEYRENFHQDQFNYDDVPRVEYISYHSSSRILGLFAQLEADLGANLVLNAGVRHDRYFGSFGGTTNPRLGLIYSPNPATSLKALYGQAFRAPNVYERNYYPDQNLLRPLRPETIRTYELVWEQYLARHYRLNLSGYRYALSSLIGQSTTSGGNVVFENLDRARATGVELELEGRWDQGWSARVSYARQRATDESNGADLTNSPRDLAKLNLILPLLPGRLSLGVEGQYHGEVLTLKRQRARDFAVANLTLTAHEFRRGWDASVSAYNVLDADYGYPGAEDHAQDLLPQGGRTLRLKLSYRF